MFDGIASDDVQLHLNDDDFVYQEKKLARLCGQHALNNLVQEPLFNLVRIILTAFLAHSVEGYLG